MRIVKQNSRTEKNEAEVERLRMENAKLRAIIEYIGALDYPEIFEDEEAE